MQRLYKCRRHRTPIAKAISTNLAKEVKLIQHKAILEVNNFWKFTKTRVRTASQANLQATAAEINNRASLAQAAANQNQSQAQSVHRD